MLKRALAIVIAALLLVHTAVASGASARSKSYVPVLIYHHLDPNISDYETVKPSDFEAQMSYLHKAGYHTITVSELETFVRTGKRLPSKPILLTFDDGYESNYQYAYPILKKYRMKATIFVIAERMGHQDLKLPRLTWEQCKEMYDSGFVDIQSHSYDLHSKVKDENGKPAPAALTRIKGKDGKLETKEAYEARVKADFILSKTLIEQKVGNHVTSFCFPFGAYNDDLVRLLKEVGFTTAFTTATGVSTYRENPMKLQRILVGGHYRGKNIENAIHNAKSKDKFVPNDK